MKDQKSSKNRIIILSSLVVVAFISGCTIVGENLVHSAYPSFKEISEAWPNLEPEKGRAVVYWSHDINRLKESVSIGGVPLSLYVNFNDSEFKVIGRRTFVFEDLEGGPNRISFKLNTIKWRQGDPIVYTLEMTPNETKYFRIENEILEGKKPVEVTKEEAFIDLEETCHSYKKPLPLSLQPKGATPAI